jgi:3' exoribonuclease, RNase T-like
MKHVMLDLETYSTRPNALILSIGAVEFDPNSDEMGRQIEIIIDSESSKSWGLHVDQGTVSWWEKRSQDARDRIFGSTNKVDLTIALHEFSEWFRGEFIWGNGADFDIPILKSSYDAVKRATPWKPYSGRCYRTIKNLASDIKMERQGTHHSAVDDAIDQARHLQTIVRHLGISV